MRRIAWLFSMLLVIGISPPGPAQSMVPLIGHTPDLENIQRNLGAAVAIPGNRTLQLQIVLNVRNKDQFARLPEEQNDPSSPYYQHEFSKEELAKNFGPTASDYQAVEAWLVSQGFQIVSVDDSFLSRSITFTGTAAQVQRGFVVQIIQSADGRMFSNTTDPKVPSALASLIGYVGRDVQCYGLWNGAEACFANFRPAIR